MEPIRIQLEKLLDPQSLNTPAIIEAGRVAIQEGRNVIMEQKLDNITAFEAYLQQFNL
jgi:hypothetical protein